MLGALGVVVVLAITCACTRTPSAPDSASSSATPGSASASTTRVVEVVDGDTIDVEAGGSTVRVRLIGLNTPESVDPRRPVECFGKEASQHTSALLPPGTFVRLERDVEARDRYGRTLAYVYRADDDVFVNLQIVADGYAHTMSIAPNVAYATEFRDAERAARRADRGLWSACPAS